MARVNTYQEQLDLAAARIEECLRKLKQAPRGLKPARQQELEGARAKLRALVRNGATHPEPAEVAGCWCGARLITTASGWICAAGTHDN